MVRGGAPADVFQTGVGLANRAPTPTRVNLYYKIPIVLECS